MQSAGWFVFHNVQTDSLTSQEQHVEDGYQFMIVDTSVLSAELFRFLFYWHHIKTRTPPLTGELHVPIFIAFEAGMSFSSDYLCYSKIIDVL